MHKLDADAGQINSYLNRRSIAKLRSQRGLPLAVRRLQKRFALPADTALTIARCAGFRAEA